MSEDGSALASFAAAPQLVMSDQQRLDYATGRIRNYCRWHIYPSITETRTFDSHGGRLLLLPTLMLTDIASITLTETGTVLDPASYRKSRLGMIQLLAGHHCWPHTSPGWSHRGYGWPVGFETVAIEFTHGYTELPVDLVEVAISVASRMPAQLAGVTQETVEKASTTWGAVLAGGIDAKSGFTIAETNVLDAYRVEPRA